MVSDGEMRIGLDFAYGMWDDSGLLVTNTSSGSTNVNGLTGNISPNYDITRPDGNDVWSNLVPTATNIYSPWGNGSYNATVMVHNVVIPYNQNTIGVWRVQGSAEDWDWDRGWFLRTNALGQRETCSWDRAWASDWRMDFTVYDDDTNNPVITSNANSRPLGVWVGSSNVDAGATYTTNATFTVYDGALNNVGGTNMLNDPGFENGWDSWSAKWGNISNSSAWAESGTNCLQYSTVGSTNEGGFYQDVPVASVAGQTFILTARARSTTNPLNGTMDLKVEYMDSSLVQLAQYIYSLPQNITTNWQTYTIAGAATPANVAFVRCTIYCITGTNYRAYFDNFRLTRADTNTLRFLVSTYDSTSGLSRGTSSAITQMNLSVGSVISSNIGNYIESHSTANGTAANSTSSWEFANFNQAQITEMVNITNLAVRSTVYDNDDDRISDRAVLNYQQFGMLRVLDDDTASPVSGNVLRVFVGASEITGIGAGSTQIFQISEGHLGNLASSPLTFHFKTYDADSGILRSTNRWEAGMSISVTNFATNDVVHYSPTLSSSQAGTMVNTASSVWQWAQSYSYADLGTLFGTTGWISPIVATVPDADADRTFDTMWLSNAVYGRMQLVDDDILGPTNSDIKFEDVWGVEAVSGTTNMQTRHVSGSGTNRLFEVSDGELRGLNGGTSVWFSFYVRDIDSGIPRGTVGPSTNANMSLSLFTTNNVANFSLTYSSADTRSSDASNVWRFATAYNYAQVTALYGVTNPILLTVPFDVDDDRANDRKPGFTNAQFGYLSVGDDDSTPPILKTWGTPNTNANLALFMGGDPALGYPSGSNTWVNPSGPLTNDNQIFIVNDGDLTNVSVSAPLDFRVWFYDSGGFSASGVSRDNATAATNTSLSVGTVIQSNVANLALALSAANNSLKAQFNCSNYWRFTSITRANVGDFYAAPGHSNQIYLTLWNSDFDRANDQESGRTNLGWLVINDDDPDMPIASDLKINGGFPDAATNRITDQQLNSGGWSIELKISDKSGVNPTWNGSLWPANYNLLAPNGSTVIVEKTFDSYYVDTTNTVFGRNMGGNVAYTSIVLGVYTMAWSALDLDDDFDGDRMTGVLSRAIYSSTSAISVVDDDATAPTVPTNVTVAPATWTNVNYFVMNFAPSIDSSGIYQYRADTNTAAPTSVTNGAVLDSAYVTSSLPYVISNGSFEVGYHWIEVPNAEDTTNGWKDYGSDGAWVWWDTNAASAGSNGTLHVVAVGNQPINGEGRYTLCAQDVYIHNTNDMPVMVDFSGYFKGNMSHVGLGGVQGVGFMKIEFFSATTTRITDVGNEWDTGYGWPFHGVNVANWSNAVIHVTNGPADTEMIRFSCGIATHGSGLSTTGFWDNLSMTARVVSLSGTGAVFTNAPEGSNNVWLFSVDDDNDRLSDRTKSVNTNFTILYDKTPPLAVTNVVTIEGTNDSTSEIIVRWSPLPNGGGNNLSPWRTYAIYYTDQASGPTTNDPFIIWTNGYPSLTNNFTTNITLTNFSFGTTYRLAVQGRDTAGNMGPLSTPTAITLSGFSVTQGVVLVTITNGPSISWTATNSAGAIVKAFDLLYVDTLDYSDALTNQWKLLTSVVDSCYMDTGWVDRTPPWQMVNTMRFYRAAQHDQWITGRVPRAASVEIYGMKTIRIYRGQNWIALPFIPDSNSVKSILGYNLPGGPLYTSTNSTRVVWYDQRYNQYPKTEIWLSKSTGQTSWQYNVGGSGTADYMAVNLTEGFVIQVPTNGPRGTNVIMFLGRIPTTTVSRSIQGTASGCYNVVTFRGPRRMHPAQMNLGGFQGTSDGNPLHSDRIWSLNRETQRANPEAWYDTSTGRWRLNITPSFPDVPTNYFGPDDAIVIHKPAGHSTPWTWIIPVLHSPPTKNISP